MKTKEKSLGLRTWIEIDKNALANNYGLIRKAIDRSCLLMAVVKSNAYGNYLEDYSKELEKLGADWFGVDSITEGLALRRSGIKKPILVLGYTLPERFLDASKNNISITISSFDSLKSLQKFKGKLNIHIKVDTGMHRQGFLLSDLKKPLEFLKYKLSNISLEGLYTHFSSAKSPDSPFETEAQIRQFKEASGIAESLGFNPIKHCAASSAAIMFKESHFDMVRIGIAMMGLWPSGGVKKAYSKKLDIRPILSWKTIISEVKKLKKGDGVGYDLTEKLKKDSTVAICPIGYWHGFRRSLSNIGEVLVNGKRAKVLGRVSMDIISIDVTDIDDVKIGNEVTIIGKDGEEEITIAEMAKLADSYNYEIVTQINPLIKRLYI